MLLHALHVKEGWHEVGITIASFTDSSARIVHFAALSHLVNELCIYDAGDGELQRLASSSIPDETNEALGHLDNIFMSLLRARRLTIKLQSLCCLDGKWPNLRIPQRS